MQLKEEMRINGRGRGGGRITMWRYGNYNELGYNIYIYKKDEEMFNIYSSD